MKTKSILFIVRRFSIGGSQVNLLSIINELVKRNYTVYLMSDKGALLVKLPDNVKWFEFPFVNLSHPSIRFYKTVTKLVLQNNVDYIFSIDPILSVECFLSYFFHKKPVYGFITAQSVPYAYPRKWPTIFVNESREILYREKFNLTTTYFIKERLDVHRFRFNSAKGNAHVKLALISRLDPVKRSSIDYVLNFFEFIRKNSDLTDFRLMVIGGGHLLDYYKEKYAVLNIDFKGEVLNIEEEMNTLNVVFGMASTILQSMATNCISVVVGDKGIQGVVTRNNVENFMFNHFNIHESNGLPNDQVLNEIIYYLKNKSELSFYKSFIDENYSVEIGVNKFENLLTMNYERDSFIFTLHVILKLKLFNIYRRIFE